MDFNQIAKDVKAAAEMHQRNNIHAEKLMIQNKEELDVAFPDLFDSIKKMSEEKDFKGMLNKVKEIQQKQKEDASKRINNG